MIDNSHIPSLSYLLANPTGKKAKDKQAPKIGEKITTKHFEELIKFNGILTVREVIPVLIGEKGDYSYQYEVYTEEFPYVPLIHYIIIN